ncbi:hypothetical protein HRbin39_00743 [bacterium HR39]|nr:hypothetical protein HRbin39_00743 [bacterium HR39]
MPHEAVEVERRAGSRVELDRLQLRQVRQRLRHGEQRALRRLQRAALGQVHHHLQLRLVVEGQQLHRHVPRVEQRHGGEGGEAHQQQEQKRPPPRAVEERGDAHVQQAEAGDALFGHRLARLLLLRAAELHAQPGRDDHRHEEAEQHGGGSVDRDGLHVGAHQPGHEEHGQQRRHHGERGDDGGIAHLRHRPHGDLHGIAARLHAPVARDVLDEDDGVVDEDADREDQREQAHPVDGIARHPGGEEGQQDGDRDRPQDDVGLAQADEQRDDEDDGKRGEEQVEEQLVGLLRGRLAVVAGHLHPHVVRDQPAVEGVEAREQLVGDGDGVRPFALGDGDGHRRKAHEPLVPVGQELPDAVQALAPSHHDVGHVLHVDGSAVAGGDEQEADVGHALQGLAAEDLDGGVALTDPPHQELAVGVAHLLDELLQGDAQKRHALGIGFDADLVGTAADDEGEADVLRLDQLVEDLLGDVVEGVVVPARQHVGRQTGARREGEGEDGDVVDAALDGERLGNAHRNAVEMGAQALVDPQDGVILGGAHVEARCHHHPVVAGLGVDVLDLLDALDDVLERFGDQFDRVLRPEAVGLDEDVHHRHRDLRLLLARQGE